MFNVGDKVIPHAKTRGKSSCRHWDNLINGKVSYLYVVEVNHSDKMLTLASESIRNGGNYYHFNDVTHYEKITEDELFSMYVRKEITQKQYEEMLKENK